MTTTTPGTTPRPTVRSARASAKPTRPVWEEPPSALGSAAKAVLVAVILLVVLFPLWVVVLTSLSTQQAITAAGGLVVVPDGITFAAYQELLTGGVVTRAVLVSVGITVVGTAFSTGISLLAAYGLSRPGTFAHRPLLFLVLLTFLFGPGLIPTYLLVQSLGMLDSYSALILPGAVSAFNLVVLRSFFMNLPGELIDSARIDGASEFGVLTRIVLPLSKGVTAVVSLFYAVGYWNAFFNAFLYLNSTEKWPLQLVLRTFVLQGQPIPGVTQGAETVGAGGGLVATLAIKMAVVVLALVPVAVVYPFVQKHFTKGVIVGAVKG
ncbi:carbohydrate ABC transporter permease [Actinosynnema pretiosum subsp. pretiosum]|uniref:Binding-protein-dependent transport systems inner membrane component n=2 Tax=Actinosynnema TaxID=40566 RepID=C6WI74_ACTMD|nr:carbohydrate ABC transporter permease [Actinosynnema mirum]ACU36117.1 binding-protein-dependent transport systems inner membrane component [Actinosynnema mirum DSM 43827]AXX29570.1 putative alpha-xyloside ABC transporter, permease component [Actinosynnema pretiosum subsp. pretiosum]QUF06198.1 carbohydrate ABC transporter permease [Actinosynnema pretiosum subsp. pretiosum]